MSNKDDGLSQLVQDVIDGKAEKKELCNKIYKEVYALAYPVYQVLTFHFLQRLRHYIYHS
jgi:hypothetical protein